MLPKAEAAGSFIVYGKIQKNVMVHPQQFITEVVFGNDNSKPVDCDKKEQRNLGAEEIPDYFFHQYSLRVEHGEFMVSAEEYSTHTSGRVVAACFETVSPPPEA